MPELVVQVIASDPSKASAKRLLLDVDLDWSVARLKQELARRTSCSAAAQKLVWRGRVIGGAGEGRSLRGAGIDDLRYTLFVAPASDKPIWPIWWPSLLPPPSAGAAVRAVATTALVLILAACVWHNGGHVLRARGEQWCGAAALVMIVLVARQQLELARRRKRGMAPGLSEAAGNGGSARGGGSGHRSRPHNGSDSTDDGDSGGSGARAEFPDDISAMMLGCGAG